MKNKFLKGVLRRKLPVIAALALSASMVFGGCGLLDDEDWDESYYEEDEDYSERDDSGSDENVDYDEKLVQDEEYGDGTATIMIYMIGSDLESQGGCASSDIDEICNATLDGNVNVIIQTGGATEWQNPNVDPNYIQRFYVENGDINLVEELDLASMVDPDTLYDFLSWGTENYPADTTGVIMWDHGGGTLCGYGVDENDPENMLSLSSIASAFEASGAHFDFVGFDACLMATIETACALEPYTDYLIASEETEPGTGWYYTDWLTSLSKNPTASVPSIGSNIIKGFMNAPDGSFYDTNTLAVIDLSKTKELQSALFTYLEDSKSELNGNGYQKVAYARSNAKSYGDGEYEQVDIKDFLDYAGTSSSDEIFKILEEAVVCFDTNISHSFGLAMYVPFDYPDYYQQMLGEFESIGFVDDSYTAFYNDFLSMMVNGQIDASVPPVSALTGYVEDPENIDYEETDWFDSEIEATVGHADFELTDNGEIFVNAEGEQAIVELSDEQWDLITYIDMCVMLDDGEGMIDFGNDNVYELDDNDNLIVDFDYNWVALNGQIVPYYAEEEGERNDGSWYTYGFVPAVLTSVEDGEESMIDIMLYWDDDHTDGYVAGYRPRTNDKGPGAYPRNLSQFMKGDKIDFTCDYYTYDGEYDDEYYFGDTLVVDGDITVSYEEVDEFTTWVYFKIKDIYQNTYYTETMEFSFNE